MAAAAPIFMGLSGIVGAVGQYQAGNYAAAQSKRAAQVGRIQADQIDASYREELNSTLANIKSIRASAGVDPNSPTGQAVNADQVRTSNRDRIIDVGSKRMFIIVKTLFWGVDVPGYASLLVAVLFLGSVQLISIGILGEYLGRIYVETKQRPTYLVRKVHGDGDA